MNLMDSENPLNQITNLEHKLATVLKPVRPDPEYVNRLRHSLGTVPTAILERRSVADPVLVAILGLAAGITAVYLIHRWVK